MNRPDPMSNVPARAVCWGGARPVTAWVIGVLLLVLAACDALTPVAPTLTPTWAYSAPTLAASPTVLILPPTEIPSGFVGPGQSNPTAASLPWDSDMPPAIVETGSDAKTVQIPLRDGVIVRGQLYEDPFARPELNQRWPGVLLIGATPADWGDFPAQLRDAGFTVLVMDLGERRSADDFSDVMQAFSGVGTVDPGLMGVVGASDGADQALVGCAMQLLCDTTVLLSPIGRAVSVNALADYNPRPLLVAASRVDPAALETAQSLHIAATGEVSVIYLDSAGHGVTLLADPELPQTVIEWLRRFLAE